MIDGDESEGLPAVPFPALVILSRGRPETVLEGYAFNLARQGIYSAPRDLMAQIVVLAELPRTRETLLLRLLGQGRVLMDALADLEALPHDAWEKSIATPLLLHFKFELIGSRVREEGDMTAEIQAWYEDYQKKLRAEARAAAEAEIRAEARAAAEAEVRAEQAARAVLTTLRVRGIAVPESSRERILAEKSPERLESWLERAVVASAAEDIFDESR